MARVPLGQRIITGDVFESQADLIAVTTNGTITASGRLGYAHLVMGRGAAADAARRYPKLSRNAARAIKEYSLYKQGPYFVYNFLVVSTDVVANPYQRQYTTLGLFQVKYDYKAPASLALIGHSVVRLNNWLDSYYPREAYPDYRVALNFPGIGYGRLPEVLVRPVLEDLDDRVEIYKLEKP